MTIMTWIYHLRIVLYCYILKFDCNISSCSGDMMSQSFWHDLVATLTLTPRPDEYFRTAISLAPNPNYKQSFNFRFIVLLKIWVVELFSHLTLATLTLTPSFKTVRASASHHIYTHAKFQRQITCTFLTNRSTKKTSSTITIQPPN